MRDLANPLDRRLVVPPPSPYEPSKGFRLLDGPVNRQYQSEPQRPRLESNRDYVFSESQMPTYDDVRPVPLRHNETWALSRSTRRSAPFLGLRLPAIVLGAVLVVGFVAYYLQSPTHGNGASNTTLTTPRTTTTTAAMPSSFRPRSSSGQIATYEVPAAQYVVHVSGSLGATYVKYQMGPSNTLEWQGTLVKGASKSLRMTGSSQITIGAPGSATVSVGTIPVVFPSPLPATLVLVFRPTTPG